MQQFIKGVVDTQKTSNVSLGSTNAGDDTVIELTIKSNGTLLEFNNPTFQLLSKKADNTKVRQINNITLEAGIIKIKCDVQTILCQGLVTNQLYIIDGEKISTVYFYFIVNPSLENEILEESKDKIESLYKLDELINISFSSLEEYEQRLNEFGVAMTIAEAEEERRKDNELLRVTTEKARTLTEENRTTNENLRISKESDRVAAENIRITKESDRTTKENDRISKESDRVNAENTRISNEADRVNAENTRVNNEKERVTKFEIIKTDYETYKNVMIDESPVANLQSQINVTNSQLDTNVQQLTNKINEVATIGTTTEVLQTTTETYIQEKISDGTIASLTILDNSITNNKYQDKSVTPKKTTFLELDSSTNLFDGNYASGISLQLSGSNYKIVSADSNRKVAILKIEPNTTYAIRIEPRSSMCRIVTSTTIKNVNETLDGTVKMDNGTSPTATFTTGVSDNYVYIMVTYTGETPYLQVLKGTDTTLKGTEYLYNLKNINVYSKSEIDGKLSKYKSKRKILFKKNSDIIDIYVPSKKTTNYLHYKFKKINDVNINFNQWRVYNTNIVDNDLSTIIPFQENIEWEGAIKENGAVDFVGGYHGDETNIDINIIVDNVDLDVSQNYDIQCDNVKIVTKSTLNRCDTPSLNLFTRYKVNEWNYDNYIITNKIIALENVNIQYCYLSMLSIPRVVNTKNIVSYARYDDDYKKTDVSATTPGGCFNPSQTARIFEMWGDGTLYAKIESIADYDKYPHITIGDRSQNNIMKAYFDLARGYQITKGEILNCKSIYTIIV